MQLHVPACIVTDLFIDVPSHSDVEVVSMATAQPSKEVTTVQVGSVSFGWYSDDEARSDNARCTALLAQCSLLTGSDMVLEVAARIGTLCPAPQIQKLSVKKIVNPIARDNLGNALPGGLLDAAMGPTEPHAS
jgi:hypothetical protein